MIEVTFHIPIRHESTISKEYMRKGYFKLFKIFISGLKKNYH